jgi:hypothetical protein
MNNIGRTLPRCRNSGTTPSPLKPTDRISDTSTTHPYHRDQFGWHGHRIEQTMSVDHQRASVSTRLLLQRGSVVLALEYINYTRKTVARIPCDAAVA